MLSPPYALPGISPLRAVLSHMEMRGGVEPLPLVGRGWGGVFIQHKNPSRLPATLPARGRVRDAAPPPLPNAIAPPSRGGTAGQTRGNTVGQTF
ncbi:hypothetical protein J2X76_002260 [Neorhizobium sp. 2083]|nr:hypothetical protein [Neorhizobium sp. 2083]